MVIDLILDRKEGFADLNAEYLEDMKCYEFDYINAAIDTNDDDTIKAALCRYIEENEYNPEIKGYITSVNWSITEEKRKITLTEAEAEKLEMLVNYYDVHGVRSILEYNREFVIDDLNTILRILKKVLEV
jgi:hypothetical protein